jgi:hypothetical protein
MSKPITEPASEAQLRAFVLGVVTAIGNEKMPERVKTTLRAAKPGSELAAINEALLHAGVRQLVEDVIADRQAGKLVESHGLHPVEA